MRPLGFGFPGELLADGEGPLPGGRWPRADRPRRGGHTRFIAIHRGGGPDWPDRVEDLMCALIPHYPGRVLPYHIGIQRDGRAVCMVHPDDHAPHAWRRNADSIGVLLLGDFRRQKASLIQLAKASDVVEALMAHYGLEPEAIRGHDALPEGSKHPDKKCPGGLLDLEFIRYAAQG